MIHSKRRTVNKHAGASAFRHDVGRTHAKNMQMKPRRGGWRL